MEQRPGAALPPRGPFNHNLAVYGWDLRDALSRHADNAGAEQRTEAGHRLVPLVRNADGSRPGACWTRRAPPGACR